MILIPAITPSIRRAYERRTNGRPGWAVYFFSQVLGLVTAFVGVMVMKDGAARLTGPLNIALAAYAVGYVVAATPMLLF